MTKKKMMEVLENDIKATIKAYDSDIATQGFYEGKYDVYRCMSVYVNIKTVDFLQQLAEGMIQAAKEAFEMCNKLKDEPCDVELVKLRDMLIDSAVPVLTYQQADMYAAHHPTKPFVDIGFRSITYRTGKVPMLVDASTGKEVPVGKLRVIGDIGADKKGKPQLLTAEEAFEIIISDFEKRNKKRKSHSRRRA